MHYSKLVISILPSAKFQHTLVDFPNTRTGAINFYNITFGQLLEKNESIVSLDAACLGVVKRFRNVAPPWRNRLLIILKPNDEHECVLSTVGSGFPLSSWPPNIPFLHNAARMGCAAIVGHLLDHYACFINTRQKKDQGTALCVAAYYGHLDVVETILQRNPDITMKNIFDETPLECAIAGQNFYNNPRTREKFYPQVRRADLKRSVPEKRLRLGTADTAETHPAWKTTNWAAIIARLRALASNP